MKRLLPSLTFLFCTIVSLFICPFKIYAQWKQTNGLYKDTINCFAVSGMDLFAGTPDGVFLSMNNGTSWVNAGLVHTYILSLCVSSTEIGKTNLFAGTADKGVFLSTDNGTSWTQVDSGLTNPTVYALVVSLNGVNETNIFVGTRQGGIFLSSDNGTSWTAVNNGLSGLLVSSLVACPTGTGPIGTSGSDIFAYSVYNAIISGVVVSTDNGTNWTQADNGLGDIYVNSFVVSPSETDSVGVGRTNLFAGTGKGIFIFQSGDTSWVNVGLTNSNVLSFAVYPHVANGSYIFAGTAGDGVFLSADNGAGWVQVDSGLADTYVQALAVSGTYLFGGTKGDGVWMRPLSEMITGVEDKQNNLPTNFSLQQNYPNPFNPSTTINYSVPKTSFVTIKVYNVLGREIKTLVNEKKSFGNYSVQFSGSSLSSGIYFYRMQSGNYSQTKKLIILK